MIDLQTSLPYSHRHHGEDDDDDYDYDYGRLEKPIKFSTFYNYVETTAQVFVLF